MLKLFCKLQEDLIQRSLNYKSSFHYPCPLFIDLFVYLFFSYVEGWG